VTTPPEDLVVGSTVRVRVVEDLTRSMIVQYAGASGDYNPLHTDELYAREIVGAPTVMAHGMLTMGLTATVLTELFGDESLATFGGRFLKPVWPGDSLDVEIQVMGTHDGGEALQLDIVTLNQDGVRVFAGQALTVGRRPNAQPGDDSHGN
jgi:acyl dehydratase